MASRLTFVLTLVALTRAPMITPPVVSETVPRMLPVACPQALGTSIATVITAIHLDMKYLLFGFNELLQIIRPSSVSIQLKITEFSNDAFALQSAFQTLQ